MRRFLYAQSTFQIMYDVIIIGGGAAGIFASIATKTAHPLARVLVLEKKNDLLAKVRLTGGGRCNLTNACFTPSILAQNYPRGSKELLSAFHRFQPKDTIDWFTHRDVPLATEADGRVFPLSNKSDTIIQCLLSQAKEAGVEISLNQKIQGISKNGDTFSISIENGAPLSCSSLILATGSSAEGFAWAKALGHSIEQPIPSLFSFTVPSSPLKIHSGICAAPVEVSICNTPFTQRGSLLITHLGFSGPCILKLSSWAARFLHEHHYRAELSINWLPDLSYEEIYQRLVSYKKTHPHRMLATEAIFGFSKSLWKVFLEFWSDLTTRKSGDIPLQTFRLLAQKLHNDRYLIEGKASHTEEFVTCGGVCLKEVSFKNMESKICPGLFFAGEILDIDGVTGGFNLQNAWTTGYLAGTFCLPQ